MASSARDRTWVDRFIRRARVFSCADFGARTRTHLCQGLPLGLAITSYPILGWLTILLLGHPAGTHWTAIRLIIMAIATTAALFALTAQPRTRTGWSAYPLFSILVLLYAALILNGGNAIFLTLQFSIAGWALLVIATLVCGVVITPLVLATALVPPHLYRRVVHNVTRCAFTPGVRVRLRWLGGVIVTLILWNLGQSVIDTVIPLLVPFPALASLLADAVSVVGWGITGSIIVTPLAVAMRPSSSAEPTGSTLKRSWVPTAGATVLVAVSLVSVVMAPRLQTTVLTYDAGLTLGQSAVASAALEPVIALEAGGDAVANAYTLRAVAEMSAHRASAANTTMQQAVWWGPSDDSVIRLRAWCAALEGNRTQSATDEIALAQIQDTAGIDMVTGLLDQRTGAPSRNSFFAAAELDPYIELTLPDTAPTSPAPTPQMATVLTNGVINEQRLIFGAAVTALDNNHDFAAAVATSTTVDGLMLNAPDSSLQPSFGQDMSTAVALSSSGDVADATRLLAATFTSTTSRSERQMVVEPLLLLTSSAMESGAGLIPETDFAMTSGTPYDQLAVGVLYFEEGNKLAAGKLFAKVARLPNSAVRAQALALLGVVDYTSGNLPQAISVAQASLALNQPTSAPLAESVLGNAEVSAELPKPSGQSIAMLTRAATDNPDAFMAWYYLARAEQADGNNRQALSDDLKALVAYGLVTGSGQSASTVVINPDGSFWAYGTDGYGVAHFTASIDNDMILLRQKANT